MILTIYLFRLKSSLTCTRCTTRAASTRPNRKTTSPPSSGLSTIHSTRYDSRNPDYQCLLGIEIDPRSNKTISRLKTIEHQFSKQSVLSYQLEKSQKIIVCLLIGKVGHVDPLSKYQEYSKGFLQYHQKNNLKVRLCYFTFRCGSISITDVFPPPPLSLSFAYCLSLYLI